MTDYDDEDDRPIRRRDPDEDDRPIRRRDADDHAEIERRETLMQRRLRRARGEEIDDDIEEYDESPRYARQSYPRGGGSFGGGFGGGGCTTAALYLTLGGITVTLLVMIFGQQIISGFTNSVPEQIREVVATPTATIRDRGGTIQQIRALNRLETQSFSIERVVEASITRGNALDFFLGDRLLLIAGGEVVAGVDLSKLSASDIDISADGEQITIRLPPSEIFSARLDNARTRVYDRQQGLFADTNQDLETQARQEAEREILNAACENQIMQKAADEARRSIEQLLLLLDFASVTVVASTGPCTAPAAPVTP